jgi:DNA polymerase III sliding clamp (beta) subunit (PCNA family)
MLKFDANLFRITFGAASNEETRYYLKGVFVEPHVNGGVTLTATDGHKLVSCYDASGSATESAIVNLGDMLKVCKPKRGEKRHVVIETGSSEASIFFTVDNASGAMPVAKALNVRIDGTFPDWRRVIPGKFETDKDEKFGFNCEYLSELANIGAEFSNHARGGSPKKNDKDSYNAMLFTENGNSPSLINWPAADFAFAVLMPMRVATKPALPDWFNAKPAYLQAAE